MIEENAKKRNKNFEDAEQKKGGGILYKETL